MLAFKPAILNSSTYIARLVWGKADMFKAELQELLNPQVWVESRDSVALRVGVELPALVTVLVSTCFADMDHRIFKQDNSIQRPC